MEWYLIVLKKYATFAGRPRPKEYWMYTLINFLIIVALAFLEVLVLGTNGTIGLVYSVAVIIPGISVIVRRLHDTGRSGWWFWIAIVPVIGIFVLLYFLIISGNDDANEYGDNPILTPAIA